jgi:hypothetical protein
MAPPARLSARAVAALGAIERVACEDLSTQQVVDVQVARLVARGLSTEEMASSLFVSRHTVRDHLKAIFQKVGVSSRGELTSKLFAEHYDEPVGPLGGSMPSSAISVAARGPVSPIRSGTVAPAASSIETISA